MRLTIIAGLILGASLAIQSMLGCSRQGESSVTRRMRFASTCMEVAPWYIAE